MSLELTKTTESILYSMTGAYLVIDMSGQIRSSNPAACEMLGYTKSELEGCDIKQLVTEDDAGQYDQHLETYQQYPNISQIVSHQKDRSVCAKRKNGSVFPIQIVLSTINIEGEELIIAEISDISELVFARKRLDQVLDNVGSYLYSLDMIDNEVDSFWISPNFTATTGWDYTKANPTDWWRNHLHPNDRAAAIEAREQGLKTGEYQHEYRLKCANGEYIWVHDTFKVDYQDGRPVRINGIVSDVSQYRQIKGDLRATEVRLAKTLSFVNIYPWALDLATGKINSPAAVDSLFGYPSGTLEHTRDRLSRFTHPDDAHIFSEAIEASKKTGHEFSAEYRIIWPDGSIHWLMCRGNVIPHTKQKNSRILGIITDVTERALLTERLEQQRQLAADLNQLITRFATETDLKSTSEDVLDILLKISGSEFGVVGEVIKDKNSQFFLKAYAISNVAWSEESHALYQQSLIDGLEFHSQNNLLGHILQSGEVLLTNDPHNHPSYSGLPEGHPALSSFLNVPLYFGGNMVGFYALGNRKGGFDEALLELLKPVDSAYAGIIQARRMARKEADNKASLLRAKEEAETANKAKSAFLSSMSHELRTPLNAILGFAQLLELELEPGSQNMDNLQTIISSGKHLLALINDVLDLSAIESGKVMLNMEQLDTATLFTHCKKLIKPFAEQHNIEVIFEDSCSQPGQLFADSTRTNQIMFNLVTNAIKYNRPGGKVFVSCEPEQENMRISVRDTGIGIPEARLSDLFIPFNRLDVDKHSDIQGTGIGLLICKQLLESMGGEIDVSSEEGVGSCFSFTLAKKGDKETRTVETEVTCDSVSVTTEDKSLIYIEDNRVNMMLVREVINRKTDLTFYSAEDPLQGIELITQHQPDIIMLDIDLPNMSGIDVLKHLRENNLCPFAKTIALSASAMAEEVEAIENAGFDICLTKPLNLNHFLELLSRELA